MGRDFLLPDLGSGLHEGEIISWNVAVGDEVKAEAPLCEIEQPPREDVHALAARPIQPSRNIFFFCFAVRCAFRRRA